MSYKEDDINLLLPAFRDCVAGVLERVREQGFDPCLRDTLRTPEEAAANARRGVGITQSMHCYGVAADVICQEHGWDCAKHRCGFFQALGEAAEAEGAVWGGRWRRRDLPHFQGVPVNQQAKIRDLGAGPGSDSARDLLVRAWLGRPGGRKPRRKPSPAQAQADRLAANAKALRTGHTEFAQETLPDPGDAI